MVSFVLNDNNQITETKELLDLLRTINRQVNKFPYEVDQIVHDTPDFWTSHIEKYNKGDCDDYALTKRRLLMEQGVPYEGLFPTVCKVDGVGHLVLVVRTDKNDYVLDSIEQSVVKVKVLKYEWLYRLEPVSGTWISIKT